MQRRPWWVHIVSVLGAVGVVALVAYMQYRSRLSAYVGYEKALRGERFGITSLADGMLSSILSGMLLGTAVFVSIAVVVYVTRSLVPAVIALVTSTLVLGTFGSLTAAYLAAHPVLLHATANAASYAFQWKTAASEAVFPGLVGMALGWFLKRRAEAREYQEAHRPVVLTKAEREARDAELAAREERMRQDIERQEKAAEEARSAGSDHVKSTASEGTAPARSEVEPSSPAPTPRPESGQPSVPSPQTAAAAPPAPVERKSVRCRSCGTSNAPMRDRCLKCGAFLAPVGAH